MQDVDRKLSLPKVSKKPLDKRNGHDTILKSMINKCQNIEIEFISGRPNAYGVITQFDNYTITVRDDAGKHKTYFKHGIFCFHAK